MLCIRLLGRFVIPMCSKQKHNNVWCVICAAENKYLNHIIHSWDDDDVHQHVIVSHSYKHHTYCVRVLALQCRLCEDVVG